MRDTTEPDETATPAGPTTAGPTTVGPTTVGRPVGGHGVLTGSARLHADRSAARRARALMAEWLTSWWGPIDGPPDGPPDGPTVGGGDRTDRALLRDRLAVVLSELVSNAVVHGATERGSGGPPQLEVELHEFHGVVRLVVADRSRRPGAAPFRPPAAPALPAPAAESGRGLFLVDQLADIWHAEPMSDGLVVWCDFSLDGRPFPSS